MHVLRGQFPAVDKLQVRSCQSSMGQQGAARPATHCRSVDDHKATVAEDVRSGRGQASAATDEIFQGTKDTRGCAQREVPFHKWEPGAHFFDDWKVLDSRDDRLGLRVRDDVGNLFGTEAPIHGDED